MLQFMGSQRVMTQQLKNMRNEGLQEQSKNSQETMCCVAHQCSTLCDPMDSSLPGSSVHGDSPAKNTAVGCHFLLQRFFPTQGLNPDLLHCRWILYILNHQRSPKKQQFSDKVLVPPQVIHITIWYTSQLFRNYAPTPVKDGIDEVSFSNPLRFQSTKTWTLSISAPILYRILCSSPFMNIPYILNLKFAQLYHLGRHCFGKELLTYCRE